MFFYDLVAFRNCLTGPDVPDCSLFCPCRSKHRDSVLQIGIVHNIVAIENSAGFVSCFSGTPALTVKLSRLLEHTDLELSNHQRPGAVGPEDQRKHIWKPKFHPYRKPRIDLV